MGTCRPQTKGCSHTVGGSGVGARCWEDEVSYTPDMKLLPSSRPCRPLCEHRTPRSPGAGRSAGAPDRSKWGGCPMEEDGGLGGRLEALVLSGSQASFLCLRQCSPRPGSLSLVPPEWGHVSAESTPVSHTLPTWFVSCYFWVYVLTFFRCSLEYPQAVTPGLPAGPVPLSSVLRD